LKPSRPTCGRRDAARLSGPSKVLSVSPSKRSLAEIMIRAAAPGGSLHRFADLLDGTRIQFFTPVRSAALQVDSPPGTSKFLSRYNKQ
jgi:hypothetical protein